MPEALIGPNAILQVVAAIGEKHEPGTLARVMQLAGLTGYINAPPSGMVAEAEVVALHRAVATCLPGQPGEAIMTRAGHETALYLLGNRIPQFAQRLMKALPPSLSAHVLLKAIARHAWTFAGSSTLQYDAGHPVRIALSGSPMFATPACQSLAARYYEAAFETLFRQLVSARTKAASLPRCPNEKGAAGNTADCTFALTWH